MSQHDFNIANQTAPSFRSDLNLALAALASLSSGGTAPSTTYANMLWYDTSANILKLRNEANSGWIDVGYLDQGVGAFRILDDTQVTNSSGTQTGLLGDQPTATWEAGTGTTESLVSPAKVRAAIDALGTPIGAGQTWQRVEASRASNTVYQNTTGQSIMVSVTGSSSVTSNAVSAYVGTTSTLGINEVVASTRNDGYFPCAQFIVPNNHYYKVTFQSSITIWAELR